MDRFREQFCVVNGADEKEFERHLKWAWKATSPALPPAADYGVWSAILGVKGSAVIRALTLSIFHSLPTRGIDRSHWPEIEARRQALAQRKAEAKRQRLEKEARKTERLRRKHAKLARLGLIPPEPAPHALNIEGMMERAMEEYGDWRLWGMP